MPYVQFSSYNVHVHVFRGAKDSIVMTASVIGVGIRGVDVCTALSANSIAVLMSAYTVMWCSKVDLACIVHVIYMYNVMYRCTCTCTLMLIDGYAIRAIGKQIA